MPMLATITDRGDFFTDNPEFLNDYDFKKLSSEEAKFVCLFGDFGSPYRKMDPEERTHECVKASGLQNTGKMGLKELYKRYYPNQPADIKSALYKYAKMQGDTVLRNSVDSIDKQIKNIQAKMRNPTSLEDSTHMKNWADAMNKYMDLRDKLINKMDGHNADRKLQAMLKAQEEEQKKLQQEEDGLSIIEDLAEDE